MPLYHIFTRITFTPAAAYAALAAGEAVAQQCRPVDWVEEWQVANGEAMEAHREAGEAAAASREGEVGTQEGREVAREGVQGSEEALAVMVGKEGMVSGEGGEGAMVADEEGTAVAALGGAKGVLEMDIEGGGEATAREEAVAREAEEG